MTAVAVTTAVAVAVEQRLSEERLPGEPETSTHGEQPCPVDAQGHRYHNDSRRPSPSAPPREPHEHHQQRYSTTGNGYSTGSATTDAMITVAARNNRSTRPKPRTRPPSSTPFPVDVIDRLSSPVGSPARPRQYGRRRSVQDAVASAVAHRQQMQLQTSVAIVSAFATEPDADTAAPDAGREQEQEPPPRLVTPLRLVVLCVLTLMQISTGFACAFLTYSHGSAVSDLVEGGQMVVLSPGTKYLEMLNYQRLFTKEKF